MSTLPCAVLGIDPGLQVTGYAVLIPQPPSETSRPNRPAVPRIADAGVIRTVRGDPLDCRVREIYTQISDILEEHRVGLVAVEKLYSHYAHPRTAILMAHARGAILLAAAMADVPTQDLPATAVKRLLTGYGLAGKQQVGRALASIFAWDHIPEPPDVCDAIAIALAAMTPLQPRARR